MRYQTPFLQKQGKDTRHKSQPACIQFVSVATACANTHTQAYKWQTAAAHAMARANTQYKLQTAGEPVQVTGLPANLNEMGHDSKRWVEGERQVKVKGLPFSLHQPVRGSMKQHTCVANGSRSG